MDQEPPNVILLTTDQHRGDHLGLAGHPVMETPNLDAFVNHGAYFPNAYTEIPSTTGARRCLLSGKGSFDCGLVGYSTSEWQETNTVAKVLADNGYHALNVGFRNLHPRRKLFGFHNVLCHDHREGYDDYMDWLKEKMGSKCIRMYHGREHGLDSNGWLARPWPYQEQYHPTAWTTNTALEMIRKRDPTKPFFIWVSYHRPHSPYDPPKFFWDMYINRNLPPIPLGEWSSHHDVDGPPERGAWRGDLTPEQNQRMRAGYMGLITHVDYEIGRMMETLSRIGLWENCLVMMTADHGDMMGDHHLHRKTYAYEGSARIPFIVRYPDSMALPSGTFEQVVGLQDVMPTILDRVGITIPESVTGQSVFNAVNGRPWREYIHGEHSPCYSKKEAMHYLTDGQEKYIYYPSSGEQRLFDLEKDRKELFDLSGDQEYKDHVELWRNRLINHLADRNDGFSDGKDLIIRKNWDAVAEKNVR